MTESLTRPFPAGLQTLLAMAAADPVAAEALLRDRAAVAAASGLALTPTEQLILRGIPDPALRRAIAELGPSLPDPERRSLLELAAATLAGLAALGLAAAPGANAAPYEYRPPAEAPLGAAKPTGIRPSYPRMVVLKVVVSRARPEAEYRAAVVGQSTSLVSLYRQHVLASDRWASVDLDATLDLSPTGKVLAVTGVGVRPVAERFRDLAVAALRSLVFPASGARGCSVSLGLRFVPR